MSTKYIIFGADHAGLSLKEALKKHLQGRSIEILDVGTHSAANCDYPTYAHDACRVALGCNGLAVLVCGSGVGMSMAANRLSHIRAVLATSEYLARMARRHNDANVLCLGEQILGSGQASAILDAFLAENFEGGRHLRRLALFDTGADASASD
ncbi:Ribose-5-phosphate isomerase B [Desulfovibrionales bacterium]